VAEGFVARYGLVRYTTRLGRTYPRTGECEAGVCRIYAAESLATALSRKAGAERELAGLEAAHAVLAARKAELLAWPARTDDDRRRRRRELDSARWDLRLISGQLARIRDAMLPMYEQWIMQSALPDLPRPLVFDHCHLHGWVRGLVCPECNNRIASLETRHEGGSDITAAVLFGYLENCPGCGPAARPRIERQITERKTALRADL
jgi:hypothetical protein